MITDEHTVAETLDIFAQTPRINRWIFDRLAPWCGDRVLEVGAGIGNLTELLLDRELVVATEISNEFVAELRRKLSARSNVVIEPLDLEDVPVEQLRRHKVDSILCVNVLEHVKDDVGALRRLAQSVAPGGRLLLYVPALPLLYGTLDKGLQHYRRYTIQHVVERMQAAGWRVIHRSYMNIWGIPGWFLNSRVLRRKLLPIKQIKLYDRLVPFFRMQERLLPFPIGMSIVAIGETLRVHA